MVGEQANPTVAHPGVDQVWAWLDEIPDPEIPVISIVDLGIVRDVDWSGDEKEECTVTVTPTYSGCPATEVIAQQIREGLTGRGIAHLKLQVQLSPPWTTDWLTAKGRASLGAYGIAPPTQQASSMNNSIAPGLVLLNRYVPQPLLACPLCGSTHTEILSQFGSTPCKSLHRCLDCREPFDHFKCH